ncbi:Mobile element protein [Candidatus Enterovibrio altilux]|uniref:Mobile element protein n=1 Tax=Candidatus Enterovibrio altilux TaxID=1927128 RepID=A0A291B6F5_9GAMM|nr:Mobile element protein [Candidatus Enterovibrio luxaltus]
MGLKVYGEGEWKVKKHGTDGKQQAWGKLPLAINYQKLYGSNQHGKTRYGYNKRSLSETAMFRVKKLLEGTLSLRKHNAQISKIDIMLKIFNKLIGLGIHKIKAII